MVLSAGSVVAGYTIEAELGRGGMGTVYRVRNPTLPRSDALKVLSEQLSQDPQFRARFEREAELAATLDHPNIITVYSRGESDGQLWIAMQYVAGSDADKELERGLMSPQRAVHIIGEVSKALDHAHRRHILHRDVKPANFLLARNDERVFLADFGIARAADAVTHLTVTGHVMASVAYAPPESLSGEPVDHRADIYSLGCSLFRMLTGRSPFARSGGMAAVAAAHLTEPPPRATDLNSTLPPAVDAVIARAMAKDPGDRYQSAGELAAAAARAIGETTDAERTTPAFPLVSPWPNEHTSRPGWSHHPAPIATPRRSRRRLVLTAIAAVVVLAAAIGTGAIFWPDDPAPTYTSQTLVHKHGSTEITSEPRAVAALGPGDGDAVLSLGVQPVAVVVPDGVLPSWAQHLVTSNNLRVLPDANAAEIAAAKPDLIIDTAEIDRAAYNALAVITKTITRPQNASEWTWQMQMEWIGRILGRSEDAKKLLDTAASEQADIRAQNPVFDGKSIEVVTVTDAGITVALPDSEAARYLTGVGFRYPSELATPTGTDGVRPVADPEELNATPTDVRVVLRTDAAAGGGSYNGLPRAFSSYRGATIVVDDPAVIAALNSPGYAATTYLNTSLVKALAGQVR